MGSSLSQPSGLTFSPEPEPGRQLRRALGAAAGRAGTAGQRAGPERADGTEQRASGHRIALF